MKRLSCFKHVAFRFECFWGQLWSIVCSIVNHTNTKSTLAWLPSPSQSSELWHLPEEHDFKFLICTCWTCSRARGVAWVKTSILMLWPGSSRIKQPMSNHLETTPALKIHCFCKAGFMHTECMITERQSETFTSSSKCKKTPFKITSTFCNIAVLNTMSCSTLHMFR